MALGEAEETPEPSLPQARTQRRRLSACSYQDLRTPASRTPRNKCPSSRRLWVLLQQPELVETGTFVLLLPVCLSGGTPWVFLTDCG